MERIILTEAVPVAAASVDHLVPRGTRQDNSRNPRFNEKLYALFPYSKRIRVLDLGCSGGGFVRDCAEDGLLAAGLEGSDFSRQNKRAEWKTIPDRLFTCDITAPFRLELESDGGRGPLTFDVITAWEVMEHIAEKDLPGVASNVARHLEKGGLWIMSISPADDIVGGINYHQTVRPRPWWLAKFAEFGWVHLPEYVAYFNTQFIRGPKYGGPRSGFHLVLGRPGEPRPRIPRERIRTRLYDRWLNCKVQKKLRLLLVG
jgi:SAM-dependent methyltransferase